MVARIFGTVRRHQKTTGENIIHVCFHCLKFIKSVLQCLREAGGSLGKNYTEHFLRHDKETNLFSLPQQIL